MFVNKKSLVLKSTMFIAAGMLLASCGSETAPKEETITPADSVETVVESDDVSY